MIADFVSADYGWLRGRNGESAMVKFRAGKNREGYFTSSDVLQQAGTIASDCCIDLQERSGVANGSNLLQTTWFQSPKVTCNIPSLLADCVKEVDIFAAETAISLLR